MTTHPETYTTDQSTFTEQLKGFLDNLLDSEGNPTRRISAEQTKYLEYQHLFLQFQLLKLNPDSPKLAKPEASASQVLIAAQYLWQIAQEEQPAINLLQTDALHTVLSSFPPLIATFLKDQTQELPVVTVISSEDGQAEEILPPPKTISEEEVLIFRSYLLKLLYSLMTIVVALNQSQDLLFIQQEIHDATSNIDEYLSHLKEIAQPVYEQVMVYQKYPFSKWLTSYAETLIASINFLLTEDRPSLEKISKYVVQAKAWLEAYHFA